MDYGVGLCRFIIKAPGGLPEEENVGREGRMAVMPTSRWIEVDTDAIIHNLKAVRSLLKENTRLIAVLKANAYGLGLVPMAQLLAGHGVDFLAVTFPEEAFALRERGISADILVFAPTGEAEIERAVQNGLTLTVTSFEDYELASRVAASLRKNLKVHIKVDTGLGRFGVSAEQVLPLARAIHQDPWLALEGVYTHFAEAGARSPRYTELQFRRLEAVVDILARHGISPPLIHCCNSAAFLRFPQMHMDAVRVGTLLGGQYPAGHIPRKLHLRDPYCFKARVTGIRELPRGTYLGYYRTYRTRAKTKIAVVPVGYVHGLGMEALSRPGGWLDLMKIVAKIVGSYLNIPRFTAMVKTEQGEFPIRGKVFMQLCLVELPCDCPLEPGAVVEVPVKRTLAPGDVCRVYLANGSPVRVEQRGIEVQVTGEG